jgi:hypothetical protein
MGNSYYECQNNECGNGFDSYSDYSFWCDCGAHFCSEECGNKESSFESDETEPTSGIIEETDREGESSTCLFCRNEDCPDVELLKWLLKRDKLTKKKAVKLYLKDQK